jgi:hypothetical protein
MTTDNLAEVLMIQEALREARRPAMFGEPRGTRREAQVRAGDENSSI